MYMGNVCYIKRIHPLIFAPPALNRFHFGRCFLDGDEGEGPQSTYAFHIQKKCSLLLITSLHLCCHGN